MSKKIVYVVCFLLFFVVSCNEGNGTSPPKPQFSISPTSHDFGSITVGNIASNTFTITNNGDATLNVTAIVFTGANASDFSTNATFPINVSSSGGTSNITVFFSPGAVGARSATMEITHNASGSPATVSLSGTGTSVVPTTILEEDFEGAATGWTAYSVGSSSGTNPWYLEDGSLRVNFTGGTGSFVNCDSDLAGSGVTLAEELWSPVIDCSSYVSGTITLEFDGNFQNLGASDKAAVVVWDGFGLQVVDTYLTDWSSTGEHKIYDVSTYAFGNSVFQIYFWYTDGGDWAWFFQVDNVKLTHIP